MEKTATLNLRINPERKHKAEMVLKSLGIPMSVAIDMFLTQVAVQQGIPFPLVMSKSVNADFMTAAELKAKISDSMQQVKKGKYKKADKVFVEFMERHK